MEQGYVWGSHTSDSLFKYGTYTYTLLLLLFVMTSMQGIYRYMPQTNHVSRVYSVAAILY
jgi:hypothetical protein